MQLSVSSACFRGWPLDRALDQIRALEFEAVELVLLGLFHPDIDDVDARRLERLLARHGLRPAALYCRPLDAADDAALAESLAHVTRTAHAAAALGAGRLVFSPRPTPQAYPYERLADACRRLAEAVGDRDVVVCLENHHGWPLSAADDYERLLARVDDPRIAITLDTGHFTSSAVDIPAFVAHWGGRIRHVHLKDRVGTRNVALGTGEVDNTAALAALRAVGYRGWVTLEEEGIEGADPPARVAAARDHARTVLDLGGQPLEESSAGA